MGEIPRGLNAHRFQAFGEPATDTPHFINWCHFEQLVTPHRVSQVYHSTRFLPLFGRVIREFGQRFGVSYTHAYRHAGFAPYALFDAFADCCQIALEAGEISP
ncbi:hypothetical protein N5C93_30590 [Pseudomonas nitroreducens]|nr:hypothetical protein [Pseudomonas nitroreducens]MDH1077188.1 hypothetical protein [Pseudomonas nitroreducens]